MFVQPRVHCPECQGQPYYCFFFLILQTKTAKCLPAGLTGLSC